MERVRTYFDKHKEFKIIDNRTMKKVKSMKRINARIGKLFEGKEILDIEIEYEPDLILSLDRLIIIEQGIMFFQLKSGYEYTKENGKLIVDFKIDIKKANKWLEKWNKIPVPVVLVWLPRPIEGKEETKNLYYIIIDENIKKEFKENRKNKKFSFDKKQILTKKNSN